MSDRTVERPILSVKKFEGTGNGYKYINKTFEPYEKLRKNVFWNGRKTLDIFYRSENPDQEPSPLDLESDVGDFYSKQASLNRCYRIKEIL